MRAELGGEKQDKNDYEDGHTVGWWTHGLRERTSVQTAELYRAEESTRDEKLVSS